MAATASPRQMGAGGHDRTAAHCLRGSGAGRPPGHRPGQLDSELPASRTHRRAVARWTPSPAESVGQRRYAAAGRHERRFLFSVDPLVRDSSTSGDVGRESRGDLRRRRARSVRAASLVPHLDVGRARAGVAVHLHRRYERPNGAPRGDRGVCALAVVRTDDGGAGATRSRLDPVSGLAYRGARRVGARTRHCGTLGTDDPVRRAARDRRDGAARCRRDGRRAGRLGVEADVDVGPSGVVSRGQRRGYLVGLAHWSRPAAARLVVHQHLATHRHWVRLFWGRFVAGSLDIAPAHSGPTGWQRDPSPALVLRLVQLARGLRVRRPRGAGGVGRVSGPPDSSRMAKRRPALRPVRRDRRGGTVCDLGLLHAAGASLRRPAALWQHQAPEPQRHLGGPRRGRAAGLVAGAAGRARRPASGTGDATVVAGPVRAGRRRGPGRRDADRWCPGASFSRGVGVGVTTRPGPTADARRSPGRRPRVDRGRGGLVATPSARAHWSARRHRRRRTAVLRLRDDRTRRRSRQRHAVAGLGRRAARRHRPSGLRRSAGRRRDALRQSRLTQCQRVYRHREYSGLRIAH